MCGCWGSFTTQNAYISGRNPILEPYRRIVQSWRTTKFTADDPDFQIEVVLEPIDGGKGTHIIVHHTQIPDGPTTYQDSWQSHY